MQTHVVQRDFFKVAKAVTLPAGQAVDVLGVLDLGRFTVKTIAISNVGANVIGTVQVQAAEHADGPWTTVATGLPASVAAGANASGSVVDVAAQYWRLPLTSTLGTTARVTFTAH